MSKRLRLSQLDYVGVGNAADYCMVSPSTIRRWINDGELHAMRLPSGQFRLSVEDFKDFLKHNHMPIRDDLLAH